MALHPSSVDIAHRACPSVVGLDIGGANLKAAHTSGAALLSPFELWKAPERLSEEIRGLLPQLPSADVLAVTMTGELCDCFESSREGVERILDAVEVGAPRHTVCIWRHPGEFVPPAEARKHPYRTAAANWRALACFSGRYAPRGCALLVDLGSTTADVIPLLDGSPIPTGAADRERLRSKELVYTGVQRTPLCALLGEGGAAEFFATTADVYVVLSMIPEEAGPARTADGRPATRQAAMRRLARMLCADLESLSEQQILALARHVFDKQRTLVADAISAVSARLPQPLGTIIGSGSGEFLIRAALARQERLSSVPYLSLAERLGPAISPAACAYAVAVLCAEHHGEQR